jgi:hypothetical protein
VTLKEKNKSFQKLRRTLLSRQPTVRIPDCTLTRLAGCSIAATLDPLKRWVRLPLLSEKTASFSVKIR